MTLPLNRSRVGLMILFVAALALVACHHKSPPPPPPPAVAATPTTAAPAPTITLRANPATIDRGGSVTLTWDARNSTSVRIEPGLGDVAATGSRDVTPGSSVTYQAVATGPGGSASDTARITVNTPPLPPPTTTEPLRPNTNLTIEELLQKNVQTVLFDYDKADIRADQVSNLTTGAAWLKQNPNVKFTIEGHCDERGSEEYNLGLGDRRANAVKQFLVSQGISDARINVISYGEERPVCRDETEDCFQRNRRAEFVLNP